MAIALDFLGISAARPERDPGDASRQAAGGVARRRARDEARRERHAAVADPDPRGVRERDRRDRGDRRLDERRAAPARDRATRPASSSRSTTSTRSPRGRRSSPTSSRAAATSRPTSSRPAASRSSPASSCGAGVVHEDAHAASTAARCAEVADGAHETPGPGGRRARGTTAQADRRPRDPARLPRAGGLRRQARRARAAASTAARRASSTPRRTASPPSRRARSSRATSS